jgi:hypothetical protein
MAVQSENERNKAVVDPLVQYIPRKGVDTALLERTDHATTARTRVTAPTTAWTTSLSIPTVSTPSRNDRAASRASWV